MNVEAEIVMQEFKLRHYQIPIYNALQEGKRFIIAILPRRAGKDYACWNLLIRQALRKPGIYWMIYPTYQMGKKIIWDGRTNDGNSFLSCIHPSLIKQVYQQDMKIRLINESIIQVVGSDTPDRLVGANCFGAVFSEYALQDESVFHQIVRPMVQANGGFCIFISTPRGKGNDLWRLWNIAQNNPNWFAYKMDIEQTGHIPVTEIQALIDSGEMEEGLAKQEFWVSFDRGIEGAYYGSYLDKARLQGRIGHVPHEPGLLVHTAMDIGVNESSGKTAMIWYQIAGQTVRVINCYQNHGLGVDHYIDKLMDYKKEHGYKYGYHFAPHDMKVREFGAGALTRYEQARQLGVTFRILEQIRNLSEGINTCWLNFHKIYFDETHCKSLLDALENYRAEWDEIKKRHSSHPVKNWALHYADAFRYMIQSLPLCDMKNTTPAELQKRYLSVVNPRGNEPDFTSGRY